jgi:hypothetical protein
MAAASQKQLGGATSLRSVVDEVFGRWPAWPWSVLSLIAVGGVVGLFAGAALRDAVIAIQPALGTAACVGYGIVAAAMLSLLPRLVRLAILWRGVARRPEAVDASWWPLKMLTAALVTTPKLRRTQQEFRSAVEAAGGQARSILADRLWPAWVVAFVAPVLGLITAWQNGAKVQLRLQQGEEISTVFPAFITQASGPMVATIAASLALMLAIVVIDQFTKGLLRHWCGVVEVADGDHPCVAERLGGEEYRELGEQLHQVARPIPEPKKLPTHHLDPDELDAMWNQSNSRDD